MSAVRLRGAYGADRFVSEAAADRSRCPTGQLLTRYGASRTAAPGGGVIYRARAAVCRACPVRARCCRGAAARSVIRPNDQPLRDRVAAYLRTRAARRHLRRRAPWIETANAELKERHGLRRARGRGRDTMLIQALGAAIAYDVKKLAQLRRPGPAAGRAALPHAVRLTDCQRCTHGAHPWGEPGRRVRRHGPSRSRSARRAATVDPDFGNGPFSNTSVHLAVRCPSWIGGRSTMVAQVDGSTPGAGGGWAAGLTALRARIAGRFARPEVRARVRRYLGGLLGRVERKNGWQLAESIGEPGPQGVQRLLNAAAWDAEGVRDDLRAYVVEHLGDAASGVLILDETAFVKKGAKSCGVGTQYVGAVGGTANAQVGVFLAYASAKGTAFIDRALYLPRAWTPTGGPDAHRGPGRRGRPGVSPPGRPALWGGKTPSTWHSRWSGPPRLGRPPRLAPQPARSIWSRRVLPPHIRRAILPPGRTGDAR